MARTMKRWELSDFGLENMTMVDVEGPLPGPGEVLVEVQAVSLNYRDLEVIADGMTNELRFPFTPVSDMAGRVVALGDGVTRFAPGDAVVSNYFTNWLDGEPKTWLEAPTQGGPVPGMLSEFVVTPAEWLVPAPEKMSPEEASTLPIAAVTAWMALIELGHLRPGDTVVVQGTGGVSLYAIQFCVAAGARVIVTSSSDEKIARAIALGATDGVNRTTSPDWEEAVIGLTGGRGADHVLEMAGGENLARSIKAVRHGGQIWIIGLLGSPDFSMPIMKLLSTRARITAVAVGPRRVLEDVIRAMEQLSIKPVLDAVYSFDDAHAAFAHLKRGAFGKVVVRVNAG